MGDNSKLPYRRMDTTNSCFVLSSDPTTNDSTLQAPAEQYYANSAVELYQGRDWSTNTRDSATDRAFPGMAQQFVTPAMLQLSMANGPGVLLVNPGDNYILDTNAHPTQAPLIYAQGNQESFLLENRIPYVANYCCDSTAAGVPRTVPSSSQFVSKGNTEHLHHTNGFVERVESINPRVMSLNTISKNDSNPSLKQWEARRSEIHKHYIEDGLSLPVVKGIMANNGFHAEEHTYKKYFRKWNWRTYERVKNYTERDCKTSTTGPSTRRRNGRKKGTNGHDTRPENSASSGLRPATAVVQQRRFVLEENITILQTPFTEYMNTIIACVRSLYINSIEGGRWQVQNRFVVQEGIHDQLIFCVASALENYESLEVNIAKGGIKKAYKLLGREIDTCDPFSLPTVWESALRMIWRKHRELAKEFLKRALTLARDKHDLHPSFAKVIYLLLRVQMLDPDMLEQVIISAYRSCVDLVIEKLLPGHLTALSLWSDFIVYMDSSSATEIQRALDSLQDLIHVSEEQNGVDHDLTLEILGQKLYLLQSTPSTTEQAEELAQDLLLRVSRRVGAGKRLEGGLLTKWKDLKHTLGSFCYARGELRMAITYMEESLMYGVVDDTDAITLNRLEAWYIERGDRDQAKRVRQLRIACSQTLLREE